MAEYLQLQKSSSVIDELEALAATGKTGREAVQKLLESPDIYSEYRASLIRRANLG